MQDLIRCLSGSIGRPARLIHRLAGVSVLAAAALAPLAAISTGVLTTTDHALAQSEGATDGLDRIIMLDGRVIEGRLLEETDLEIKIMVVYAGIEAPSSYPRSEILRIERGTWREDAESKDGEAEKAEADDASAPITLKPREQSVYGSRSERERPLVYYMELKGENGQDIHPKPIRDAVEDARRYEPDYLIVKLDNDWTFPFGEEIPDEVAVSFDTYSIVEDMEPIFRTEIDQTWDERPEVVFWVENAMGGICLLPFVADRIYFHPEGRMGGIGTLEQMFEGVGDEVVRQKQRSLRLARAQGIAIAGGYDYRLVTAMARRSYVLSYRIGANGAELIEREPKFPGEFPLTDDGAGENVDSLEARIRGNTNDTLVLREQSARQLGLSSGTASTLEEVLNQLGILRNHDLADGKGTRILESWAQSRKRAERQLPELWERYNEAGELARGDARRRIGIQINALEEALAIVQRYENALDPFEVGRRGYPVNLLQPISLRIQLEQERLNLLAIRN